MERHIPRTPPRGWTDAQWNEFAGKLRAAARGYYTLNRVNIVMFLLWIADIVLFYFLSDVFEAACGETNRTALEEAGVGVDLGDLWIGPCTFTIAIIWVVPSLILPVVLPPCFVNRLNRRVDERRLGPLCIEFGLTLRVWTEKIEISDDYITYEVHRELSY